MLHTVRSGKRTYRSLFMAMIAMLFLASCGEDSTTTTVEPEPEDLRTQFNLQTLGPIPYPANNGPRFERIALGRLLFFDPILGGEKDVACATCHHPDFGFGDGRALPVGTSGIGMGPNRYLNTSMITGNPVSLTPRNAPSLWNVAYNHDENGVPSHEGVMFWDGRVNSLEVQATKPITSRVEMRGDAIPGTDEEAAALALDTVLVRLRDIHEYEQLFRAAFPEEAAEIDAGTRETAIDSSTYGRAIAAFEREIVSNNSPYDQFVRGDDDALTEQQKRGLELYYTKAKCADCHNGAMFSDFSFVVQGVPQEGPGKEVIPGDDTGREEFTHDPADRYAFRTPTLRNVELTAPYMHDGVFTTLEEVMDFYNDGAFPRHPPVGDDILHESLREPLGLTQQEIDDVIAFMRAMTDNGSQLPAYLLEVPERVPSGLLPLFGVRGLGSGKTDQASTGK